MERVPGTVDAAEGAAHGSRQSGKSAAIHACAKEQGFKVLETCLATERQRSRMQSTGPLSNSEAVQEFDNKVIEFIPISDEEDSFGASGASGKRVCNDNETGFGQSKVKTLILFEVVDISFPEDRGFVAGIQQIAEKAKGPVILTSNSNNLVLPDNLNMLELCFTMPSQEELLHYLYMVCAAEKATIQPHLLEQLIKCCQGDIQKTIMHLQFWCQSKQYQRDRKLQKTYGMRQLDVEAGHSVLPTIIPWDFPSQLSELVGKEIAKTLSMMEEN
ncbi:hypothetical protein CRYUN_Cryun35bG0066800 [Craigia yunnanensis]